MASRGLACALSLILSAPWWPRGRPSFHAWQLVVQFLAQASAAREAGQARSPPPRVTMAVPFVRTFRCRSLARRQPHDIDACSAAICAPSIHELAPLLEEIRALVSGFHLIRDRMRQGGFRDF